MVPPNKLILNTTNTPLTGTKGEIDTALHGIAASGYTGEITIRDTTSKIKTALATYAGAGNR